MNVNGIIREFPARCQLNVNVILVNMRLRRKYRNAIFLTEHAISIQKLEVVTGTIIQMLGYVDDVHGIGMSYM